MLRKRLIPLLLLKNEALVKGKNFNNYRYLGDSMNTIKIFNEKMADELIFIDIEATKSNKSIDLDFVRDVADECYMPFTVGGGIKSIDDIKRILGAGAEKVSINSQSIIDKYFIKEASRFFGSQSIVVSLDVNKDWFGRRKVVYHCAKKKTKLDPIKWAMELQELGAGEILLNMVYNDGHMNGYDTHFINSISSKLKIPLIAAGGAGSNTHLRELFRETTASAAAAGSLFIFHGSKKAFLVNYPGYEKKLEIVK